GHGAVDRGDVDDRASVYLGPLRQPAASDALSKEERPAKVRGHQRVEAPGCGLQHVLAFGDLDSRVVDEHIEPAESREGAIDKRAMLTEIGDVAMHKSAGAAALMDARQRLRDQRVLDDIVDDDFVAVFREGPGD